MLSDANKEMQLKAEESKVREEYIGVLKAELERSAREIEDL